MSDTNMSQEELTFAETKAIVTQKVAAWMKTQRQKKPKEKPKSRMPGWTFVKEKLLPLLTCNKYGRDSAKGKKAIEGE